MSEKPQIFYNVQHSPVGAFASFTLGLKGTMGGLGLELTGPACTSVFIGCQNEDGTYGAFPFFTDPVDERKRYETENPEAAKLPGAPVSIISDEKINRQLTPCTDTFSSGDMKFSIYSPFHKIPDPSKASKDELKKYLIPAVFATLEIDNTKGTKARKAFFGYHGKDPYSNMRTHRNGNLKGVAQGLTTGIFTKDAMEPAQAFTLDAVLLATVPESLDFLLGPTAVLTGMVPPGEKTVFHFAITFFRPGPVTSGIDSIYLYTKYYRNLEDAADYGLTHFNAYVQASEAADKMLAYDKLSKDRSFLLSQAIHSYLGSTQLLDHENTPLWVVNEGEYRMMNTFDLTVDQTFFEMMIHPWTVKNILRFYIKRYSYHDHVFSPGSKEMHPGGISFTHDMGVGNVFTPPGRSCYEMPLLKGCFSYMTMEQLLNFILTSGLYAHGCQDPEFLSEISSVLEKCLTSLLNRDHPDPSKRDGLMKFDSSRTINGAEITTYDSLDASLGQSRNNLYIAMKCWASCLTLYSLFQKLGNESLAAQALFQAKLISQTMLSRINPDGTLYAVQEPGQKSLIIPVIEGLVYPQFMGMGDFSKKEFAELHSALSKHVKAVLRKGICLFADGGFKLSSTSNNSWLSKIFLSQYIISNILGIADAHVFEAADKAHVNWLLDPYNSFYAFCDQILAGKVCGSRYYPRGVTAVLWNL